MPEAIHSPVQPILSIAKEFVVASPIVRIGLHCLRLNHEIWWRYDRYRRYSKPHNWIYLAGGYALNSAPFLKYSIQIYTISFRVYRLIQELDTFKQSLTDFTSSLTNGERLRSLLSWQTFTINGIKSSALGCIGSGFLNVSARCWEVYDGFYMDKNNEIVLDLVEGIEAFENDKAKVKEALSTIIPKIVPLISNEIKPESILIIIENALEKSAQCKKIATQVVDTVRDYHERALEDPVWPEEDFSVASSPKYARAVAQKGVQLAAKNPRIFGAGLALVVYGIYRRWFRRDKDGL